MGLDANQFRLYIVRPALNSISLYSESAENLIIGTALLESDLTYIRQKEGRAYSIMQIEPATYRWLRKHLMEEYNKLYNRIKTALYMDLLPIEPDYLFGNLSAAVMFARLKYYFDPEPLPPYNDAIGLANYYKKIYNTAFGATELEKAISVFNSVINL